MRGKPWWAWCAAATALVVGALGSLVPGPSFDPVHGVAREVVLIVIIAAGLIALSEPGQRRNGIVLLLIAPAAALDEVGATTTGPWLFVSYVLDPFDGLLLLLLLLRWPQDRLRTRAQVRMLWVSFVAIPVLQLADGLTWDPAADDARIRNWFPVLVADQRINAWITAVRVTTELVLLVVYLGFLTARVRSATRPERRELVPVIVSAVLLTGLYLGFFGAELRGWTPPWWYGLLFTTAYLTVPLSLLIAVGVRRVQRALAVEALLRPERLATPAALRAELARAMGDDRLDLALHSPAHGGYVDVDGAHAAPVPPGRHAIEVPADDGTPVARICIDQRLADRPDITGSVLRAAGLALDHARLQADLRAQLRETEASRLLLEEAAEEGERLSRLLPSGLADKLRADPSAVDRTERMTVTVLMSDVRGYTGIAERTDPSVLARQIDEHRQAMNRAVLAEGGTVMQYVGDAVMAVFGAPFPQPDHAARALRAATEMHARQADVNARWAEAGLSPFGLGIGLSTGPVAAALLGGAERVEYTLVGDTVNLAQRLQDAARPAGTTVVSAATVEAADEEPADRLVQLGPLEVKGRRTPVHAYRLVEPALVQGLRG